MDLPLTMRRRLLNVAKVVQLVDSHGQRARKEPILAISILFPFTKSIHNHMEWLRDHALPFVEEDMRFALP